MALDFDFSQVEQKFLELEKKVAKEITDNALREGGKILLKEQINEVPKDTGKLKDSLIVGKISGTKENRKILVGIDPAKAEEVRYGFYQEHGTDVMLGKRWMKKSFNYSIKEANQKIAESLARDLGGG